MDMIDGQQGRLVTKAAMRAFSWIIARTSALAASKAHIDYLRRVCLKPPLPPFAIVLSDSGKKHLLCRGVVNYGGDTVALTLEEERITYQPELLESRIDLCSRIAAVSGKPALANDVPVSMAAKVMELYQDGEEMIEEWAVVRHEPLSRLASWLCPSKDQCRNLYLQSENVA